MKVNLEKAPKEYLEFLRDLANREIRDLHKMECVVGRGIESRARIIDWLDFLERISIELNLRNEKN